MRRNLPLTLVLLLLVSVTKAQQNCKPVWIKDLLPLMEMNFDNIDTRLSEWCFSMSEIINDTGEKKRSYLRKATKGEVPDGISFGNLSGLDYITYNTEDVNKYSGLKKELNELGFKLEGEDIETKGRVLFNYKKGKYKIVVLVFTKPEPGTYKYGFTIEK